MDINTIEEDVIKFIEKFFAHSYEIIDSNFNFIGEHKLLEPKQNYFFVLPYLHAIMNHFRNLDHTFFSDTLKKLDRDTKNLLTMHTEHKKQTQNIDDVFEKRFLKKTKFFKDLQDEINLLKNKEDLDENDKKDIAVMHKHYLQMKEIYWNIFEEEMQNIFRETTESLKIILNCKAYYLDQLLWIEANNSSIITRQLKSLKDTEQISSKIYIQHKLEVDLPYSDEYKYLKKCIKVYQC